MNTLTIPLSQGKSTVVDEIDADLAAVKWCVSTKRNQSYAVRSQWKAPRLVLHRIILERILSRQLVGDECVDHIDGDSLNNRRSNIRLATRGQNSTNRRRTVPSKSGLYGVSLDTRRSPKKWRTEITVRGKRIYLGRFENAYEAHEVYKQASLKYFGEFSPFYAAAQEQGKP